MARNYPADVRLQTFYTENYDLEAKGRINFFRERTLGTDLRVPRQRQRGIPAGLPQINPMQFARQQKLKEDENIAKLKSEATKLNCADVMMGVPAATKDKLYDGFTKEEKGRYAYLKDRNHDIPENKYTYPITSTMDYGWKVLDQFKLKRSDHAVNNITRYTFYTRSGIPTLSQPAASNAHRRSTSTTIF